ncbi:ABC transporter substrate-binding protein [Aliarcobacter skirrowii]|uniref:Iron ABC transporter substrate-binding protein n=1 Tax=Aliarcobacter skirrowii CCUG 10374 TaxID=1032239 RepID=A0AAD0SLV2_9BACT|nr:helical backbone metal receptor [Aliarcobacter skirrowii]AXX85014.1 iron siderophore ABC transporter, periplasmic substrate-binding protein [Aliarcobacter skirrowii CCUG 10374]KAB0620824.1 ABC transporter substrate-binding protein [Aliarcobacter skirrowii CCUG 10374]RXI25832.1 iron ABC transporter substrate-binding protein [Aliarcobacter skirrowii CCUG 10374]SUU96463.1 Vitamin B12-binding protein precursor [Aliarcobacter skirrowii]HAC70733.1 iron ABC transporter substrate-binding protein [A
MKKLLYFLIFFNISFLNILSANEKIITLSPAVNEIAFALGLGNNIIANTQFCDYPEISKSIEKVGGYGSVSLEKVVNLNPSIIINQNYDKKLNSSLNALGFKTLVYKTDSLDDIKFAIKDLGDVFNRQNEAKILNTNIENSLKNIENIVENQKILIVISPQDTLSNQIYVTNNYIYFEDIIKKSGNKNAYQSSLKSQPAINSEKLILLNPDIIILLAPYLKSDKQKDDMLNLWKNLPVNASKKDNIYIIDKTYSGISSHRVQYLIDDFRKILEDVRTKKLQ